MLAVSLVASMRMLLDWDFDPFALSGILMHWLCGEYETLKIDSNGINKFKKSLMNGSSV